MHTSPSAFFPCTCAPEHPTPASQSYDTTQSENRPLGPLAREFVKHLLSEESGIIDLSYARELLELRPESRRIYDVTIILKLVGLTEKTSRGSIQWKVNGGCSSEHQRAIRTAREKLKSLKSREMELDTVIGKLERMRDSEGLHSPPSFQNNAVLATSGDQLLGRDCPDYGRTSRGGDGLRDDRFGQGLGTPSNLTIPTRFPGAGYNFPVGSMVYGSGLEPNSYAQDCSPRNNPVDPSLGIHSYNLTSPTSCSRYSFRGEGGDSLSPPGNSLRDDRFGQGLGTASNPTNPTSFPGVGYNLAVGSMVSGSGLEPHHNRNASEWLSF